VRRVFVMFLLLACLVVAGCADHNDKDSDNRFGGFYGGINGGGGVSRQ
jgi:hypothetical protein